MLELMLAALAMQAPDPCFVGPPEAAPAQCPRWRQVRLVRQITDATGYVDPGSVRRDGTAVELSTLTVLTAPIANNISRFVVRARLDCAARTSVVLRTTGYDAAGVQVHDAPVTADAPQPAPAGSPRAVLMDEFCPR
jgi:hypothetical protein